MPSESEITEREQIKNKQAQERSRRLNEILESTARKKIIVAGPGTGKTFTFQKILELNKGGDNLALTFIRKLAGDMEASLKDLAEVKTFHAYCKKILHKKNGRVELVAYLTEIVTKDAALLGYQFVDFDNKFQRLEEKSPELRLYLERGDYYEVISFNDSVYRLLKELQRDITIIPEFDQILIDEFQDFNPLEVAFIDMLEKRGPIIIVGDDDQAIYDNRNASPNYLREKYKSGEYEQFQLPFCSRCPEAIVEATNSIIRYVLKNGVFENHIPKPFKCFLADKEEENIRFPKIITARCTNAVCVSRYVDKVITEICEADILESWMEGAEYPTVLIVGPKQYLLKIEKDLKEAHPQIQYAKPGNNGYSLPDGYLQLINVKDSNLGWRIIAEFFLDAEELSTAIKNSTKGIPMPEILGEIFVLKHRRIVEIIRNSFLAWELSKEDRKEIESIIGDSVNEVEAFFFPPEKKEFVVDKTKPSILLTSFKGCKGLSAGYVIIVGANDGSIPINPRDVTDVEVSQFIVALTRARKQCHVIGSKWLYSPKTNDGKWIDASERTSFMNLIPDKYIQDLGDINAAKIAAL